MSRLLGTPAVRANLEAAMLAYFRIPNLDTAVIDLSVAPDFTNGVRASMYPRVGALHPGRCGTVPWLACLVAQDLRQHRARAALRRDRSSRRDDRHVRRRRLAPDARGSPHLARVLDRDVAPGSALRRRPGIGGERSVSARAEPPFPEELKDAIAAADLELAGKTEREKSAYLQNMRSLALVATSASTRTASPENFDVIGKYRTMDLEGRPIRSLRSRCHLSPSRSAGGAAVPDAASMADTLASGGAFVSCMTKNFIASRARRRQHGASIGCATVAIRIASTRATRASAR